MRLLYTAITYVVSLMVVAAVALFAVLLLAGPHAGALPDFLQPVVLLLGWLAVLGLPAFAAFRVWQKVSIPRQGPGL